MSLTRSEFVFDAFLYVCTTIEFVALSYLFYAMCLRTSPIRQAYFVLSILGDIIDFAAKLSGSISFNGKFKNVVLWHDYFLFGMLGLVLTLNRYTAIAYWNKHHRFWSFRSTCAWCVFLLAYPVIVDVGFLASDPNGFICLPDPYINKECEKVYGRMGIRQCISNVITGIGSITISAMTIGKIRQTSAPQIATKLFVQSCVSNAFFVVFTISKGLVGIMWIQGLAANLTLANTVTEFANLANYTRQCVNIIWLVVITRSLIRTSKQIAVATTITSLTTIK
uniref:G_PROTEIN_RECEP_F1_2 domain-containing protein n=1 Tax=Panagrellus redivivus TaxID=6233 RepID=A0A7E4UX07_PANRE